MLGSAVARLLDRLYRSSKDDGADDDSRRCADGLQAHAQAAFTAEHSRYDAGEAKAARYVTVLALVLGATAIKIDDLLWTVRHSSLGLYWKVPFVAAYFVTFLTAFYALVKAVQTMGVESVPAIPLDDRLPKLYRDHRYSEATNAMARAFFDETQELRKVNEKRAAALRVVLKGLRLALWGAAMSVLPYLPLRWRAPEKAEIAAPAPSTVGTAPMAKPDTGNSTPQVAPTKPPSTALPPKFDRVTRDAPPHHGNPAKK